MISNRRASLVSEARHQHQTAGPVGFEFCTGEQLRATDGRRLNHSLVVSDLTQDQEFAILAFGDGGQRQFCQTRPVRGHRSRLDLELTGAAQHLGDADQRAAESVADLGRISRNPMKRSNRAKKPSPESTDEGVDGVGSQASACGKVDIRIHSKGVTLMPALIIGLDLAKHVFQVHGTDQNGEVVLRKKLRRSEMVESSGNCPVVSLAWKRVAPRTTGVGC